MTTQLIPVSPRPVGPETIPTVNARELHSFLEVKRAFSHWIKDQIERARLVENRDFVTAVIKDNRQILVEYYLTIDAGKHIGMISNTDKGFEVRDYFIECERVAKNPIAQLNDPASLRALLLVNVEKVIALEHKVEVMQPKVDALDRLTDSDGWLCLRDAAKACKMAQNKFIDWLIVNRWLYRDQKGKLRGRSEKTPTFVNHKITPIPIDDDVDRVSMQPMITAAGLTKLSGIFNIELEATA